MRKIFILIILGVILSGCASYRFQKPATSGAVGYLACYDGKPILEYTVGKEKSLPDLALAKERFKRRRKTVEYYYKQMDLIESRLKEFFWDPPAMLVDLIGGILRWPFIAVADYKYNRNPKYKEKIDKLDEQKDELEKARQDSLKKKLATYILEDLNKESPLQQRLEVKPKESLKESVVLSEIQETVPSVEKSVAQELALQAPTVATTPIPALESTPVLVVESPKEIKPVPVVPVVIKEIAEPPVAIIVAKPMKGSSPLKVNFSAQKSYSKSRKIVAYDWNFGDGDTSTKKNTENTYWSTTFGSRNFTTTLSVKDDLGNVSSTTVIIEVSNQ